MDYLIHEEVNLFFIKLYGQKAVIKNLITRGSRYKTNLS